MPRDSNATRGGLVKGGIRTLNWLICTPDFEFLHPHIDAYFGTVRLHRRSQRSQSDGAPGTFLKVESAWVAIKSVTGTLP
jgi:hypothetical protein